MLAWIGYIGVGRCIDEWRFLLCCGGLGFWEEVRSWLLRRPEWDGDDEYRPSVMAVSYTHLTLPTIYSV